MLLYAGTLFHGLFQILWGVTGFVTSGVDFTVVVGVVVAISVVGVRVVGVVGLVVVVVVVLVVVVVVERTVELGTL